jgi:hypothetical protein
MRTKNDEDQIVDTITYILNNGHNIKSEEKAEIAFLESEMLTIIEVFSGALKNCLKRRIREESIRDV